ncbi:MAG TPA: DUF357 domain-containing protein [Candidatus Acidoferrales bacterium]|nr:DUF357 domain-containing protein [Candidatus Acidoferrales bacterium]
MPEIKDKVAHYEAKLREALARVESATDHEESNTFLIMARAYYADGCYFCKREDLVNALVCFSYGHGWLDAGLSAGALRNH